MSENNAVNENTYDDEDYENDPFWIEVARRVREANENPDSVTRILMPLGVVSYHEENNTISFDLGDEEPVRPGEIVLVFPVNPESDVENLQDGQVASIENNVCVVELVDDATMNAILLQRKQSSNS